MIIARQIRPKPFRAGAIKDILLKELAVIGKEIRLDYRSTTATWEGVKPAFEIDTSITANRYRIYVGPRGLSGKGRQKWLWVSEGTKAHDIAAGVISGKGKKKALAFPGTFTAKTIPGVIGSGPGASGGETVVRRIVHHPGTKPRKFDKVIGKKWRPLVFKRMQSAMKRAAAASGHRRA